MSWHSWFGRKASAASADAPGTVLPGPEPDAAAEPAVQAGMAAAHAGNHAEAAAHFERALERAPEMAIAHRELARARLELGDAVAAADSLQLAAHFSPDDAWTYFLLGLAAQRAGDPDSALRHYSHALELDPAMAEAHNNLGYVLLNEFDRVDDALAHFDAALRARPGYADAMLNQGLAQFHSGRRETAIGTFSAVVRLDPQSGEARLNRALARLALRRWSDDKEAAWDEYEVRKRVGAHWVPRPYAFPEWDGAAAPGKTLLLYAEQGLGDEIMFASCIGEARARVGHCVVECAPKLASLFGRSFADCKVVGLRQGEPADWFKTAPRIDMQLAVGSLPRLFRRTAAAFPAHAGYLRADPQKVAAWHSRLQALGPRPKIALSWRGGTRLTRSGRRSIPVPELARTLHAVPADFISLQYDGNDRELGMFAEYGIKVHSWPQAIADYDETAALLCATDLVLSVCTALIHLGGALGRPVWVLVPAHPEWRYGESGEDMPWYPSVRLLRQAEPGDWAPLLARLGPDLGARISGGAG